MQETSSDKRIDGEITPGKKTVEEPANENSQLTPEQPISDNTASANPCER